MERLLIGILTYNRLLFTKQCIESLYENTDESDFELVIHDNGSIDGTTDYIHQLTKEKSNLKVSYSTKNLGVAGGLNHILKHQRKLSQHFMKLDNDIVFKKNTDKNWIKKIQEIFNTNIIIKDQNQIDLKIGAICIKPYTWDELEKKEKNLVQEYPEHLIGKWKFQYNPEGVLGCSTIFRSDVFDFFKKFDEDFTYGYEESLMHSEMLKNKYISLFSNEIARVYHIDPGGDTDYIKWKHQQAKDGFNKYLEKFNKINER